MRIGEVAANVGISVQTIRYYERRGLLQKTARLASGYRVYSNHEVEVLRFIKQSQQLGYRLQEIAQLLRLFAQKDSNGKQMRALVAEKVENLNAQIRQMQQMRDRLSSLLDSCRCGQPDQPRCPALETLNLSGDEPCAAQSGRQN